MANALKEIEHAQRLCDRGEITIGEYIDLVRKWADAEPVRHGHWIERTKVYPDLLNDSTYNYECSECGYMDTHVANVEVPYCWHCGVKMDESTMDQVKPSDKEFTLYVEEKPIVTFKDSKIVLHGERREDETD